MVRVPPAPGTSRLGPNIIGMGTQPAAPGGVPGGGMTLDALINRQKLLANQQIELPQMTSPMQGAGYLAQSVMQGLSQGRADKELAQGRTALAQAMTQFNPDTGEFTPEAMQVIGALEPDKAFTVLHDMAESRRQERQRQEEHGWKTEEQQQQQTFQHGENEATRAQQAADAAAQRAQQTNLQEDRQEADRLAAIAKTEADKQAAIESNTRLVEEKKREEALPQTTIAKIEAEVKNGNLTREQADAQIAAEQAKGAPDKWGPVPANIAQAQGGDVQRNPSAYRYNAKTGDVEPVKPAASASEVDSQQKLKGKLIETRGQINTLQRAMQLAPNVFQGATAKQRADAVVATNGAGVSPETLQQAKDTQEFFRIMDLNAVTQMAQTLSGSDSDRDVERFMRILSDPRTDPQQKQAQIQALIDKGRLYERTQAEGVRQIGGDPDKMTLDSSGGSGGSGGSGSVKAVTTQADYDALKPGETYSLPGDPPGTVRTKK